MLPCGWAGNFLYAQQSSPLGLLYSSLTTCLLCRGVAGTRGSGILITVQVLIRPSDLAIYTPSPVGKPCKL